MYYPKTIAAIRLAIEKASPGTTAHYSELVKGKVAPLSYLLWMCAEIERMDTASIDEAAKAGRWLGWILAYLELAGIWDNSQSRDFVREDRKAGFDKPHPR